MSALSAFLFKQKMRRYARGINRAHELRRRLAYYVAMRGFSIGDYSIGDPTVRLFSDSRLVVGKYSSIAAGATFILGGNHRTDFVTTSLLERPSGKRPDPRTFSRGDIVVGSDVWIAGNVTILSGVTIGDGAVIGAGAVVLDDVPPYGIALGNPARLVRKRFPDLLIAELLALRWWDLPRERIEQLQPLLHSADVAAFIAECRKHAKAPPQTDIPIARMTTQRVAAAAPEDEIAAVVHRVLPNVSPDDYARPLADIGVDSFAMLTLRLELEQLMHGAIPDQSWLAATTLRGLFGLAAQARYTRAPIVQGAPAAARRSLTLNMPQMTQGGLSESWLFKEAGDLHWELLQKGLRAPSSQLADSEGNRLYATFTRIRLEGDAPLRAYRENEPVEIEARIARYGAGMFFSDMALRGDGKRVRIKMMSSFSKRGDADENTSLLRGQPQLPPDCEIPALAALPDFAQAYRARRGATLDPPIFETEYEIVPAHDINGVGLLYFAAYPIIKDICATRYAGRAALANMSTLSRDIFYLANCNPDETLVYRLHRWHAEGNGIAVEESLSRKSDGALMSYAVTRKQARSG